ncbi:hypothetical protein EDC01DRAFT_634266 [Geopyxis carbonaria]|nr:hypothetical protein EDC01DRAFT_634266 [Geopyxis carbonaria]
MFAATSRIAARPVLRAAARPVQRRAYRIDPLDIQRHQNPAKTWIGALTATGVVTYGLCHSIVSYSSLISWGYGADLVVARKSPRVFNNGVGRGMGMDMSMGMGTGMGMGGWSEKQLRAQVSGEQGIGKGWL